MKLADKLALVTGASSGIGAATARALAARGATVLVTARNSNALDALTSEIHAQRERAFAFAADLTDFNSVERIAVEITRMHGIPDLIVNNAGAGRWLYADETPYALVEELMAAPYFCAFYVTRAFLPEMLARDSGFIVNVNSPAALTPWAGATGYTAARWALRGFTNALRVDLARTRLRVMHVVAAEVNSPYWENNPGARERLPWITRFFGTLTPEQVASGIVRGIEQERTELKLPRRYALAMLWVQPFPFVGEWLMRVSSQPRSQKTLDAPSDVRELTK